LNKTAKPKEREMPNASEKYCVNSYSSAFTEHFSKKTAEQAMEKLEMVENFQKDGQYEDAISCCQSALLLLDSSDNINLRMKFCSNMMQLYFLMDNFDEALNVYYDSCVDVLESVSDPKVIQSIMDLYTLCTNVFK
jgi:tetratricopeptide (TPR) repeat protein